VTADDDPTDEELVEWLAFAWDHRDETDSARIVSLVREVQTWRAAAKS